MEENVKLKSDNADPSLDRSSNLPKDSFARPKKPKPYHGKANESNSRDNRPEKPEVYENRPKLSRVESLRIFEDDVKAYENLRPSLLDNTQYSGKFVAIVDGKCVDSDTDRMTLIQRVYKNHGNVPMYAVKVGQEKEYVDIPFS